MAWPPKIGDPLPRAAEATGVRRKLSAYCLDPSHESGGSKARGFELILGITIDDLGYLEGAILTGAVTVEICAVRDNAPYGVNCAIGVPVRGRGGKEGRLAEVRTVWEVADGDAVPRLVSAFPRI
jgi:hypothetical protein